MQFVALILFELVTCFVESPGSIKELIGWVYPEDAPEFISIESPAMLAVAGNDTAIMKLSDVDIKPYPLIPGYVDFTYFHNIVEDVPTGSIMKVHSFVDGKEFFDGQVNICEYLKFAKLECPLEAYKGFQSRETKLLVPNNGYDNRFSFVAQVETPTGEMILHLAAIVDCIEPIRDEL